MIKEYKKERDLIKDIELIFELDQSELTTLVIIQYLMSKRIKALNIDSVTHQ